MDRTCPLPSAAECKDPHHVVREAGSRPGTCLDIHLEAQSNQFRDRICAPTQDSPDKIMDLLSPPGGPGFASVYGPFTPYHIFRVAQAQRGTSESLTFRTQHAFSRGAELAWCLCDPSLSRIDLSRYTDSQLAVQSPEGQVLHSRRLELI